MREHELLLRLSAEDAQILYATSARLRARHSDILRWALRWYGAAGPWRHSDERALSPLDGREGDLDYGPPGQEARS